MVDRYLGIVLVAVVLWYLFKDANGTARVVNSLSSFNTSAIAALQGRNAGLAVG